MIPSFIQWISTRLQAALPGHAAQVKMISNLHRPQASEAPAHARHSSVLLLLTIQDDMPYITLIQRTEDGGAHSGQIAFPGGKQEPSDPDLAYTALREAHEEINLNPNEVTILGPLTAMYIPVSNFIVQPILAYSENLNNLHPSPQEVAQIFTIRLEDLFNHKTDVTMTIYHPTKMRIQTPAYMLENETHVWGATAMLLAELEHLYKEYQENL